MASDDEIDAEDLDEEGFLEEGEDDDVDIDLLDEDELDEEELDDVDVDEGAAVDESEEDESAAVVRPKRAVEDEDEDLTTADDVEADLAHILDERLRERSEDEEQEEEEELPSNVDPETSIQPKRPDERMCPQCFLLVRKGAPTCPVGDDTCPLIPS